MILPQMFQLLAGKSDPSGRFLQTLEYSVQKLQLRGWLRILTQHYRCPVSDNSVKN